MTCEFSRTPGKEGPFIQEFAAVVRDCDEARTRANGRSEREGAEGKDGGWDKLEAYSGVVKCKRGRVPTASEICESPEAAKMVPLAKGMDG